jgi:predicted RND superfamily exporter protein
MHRLEKRLGALAVAGHKRPLVGLAIAAVLSAVGAFFSAQLDVVADLEKLLPQSFKSVQDLEPLKERFGGIGHIIFVGENASPEMLKQFAEDIAPELPKALPDIRYVDYKPVASFFKSHALYYLDVDDLKEVQRRIKEYEKYQRRQANPMLVKLDDEEAPSIDMSDIEAKYGKRSDQRLGSAGDDYYIDPQKQLIVLFAKPGTSSSNLTYMNELLQAADKLIARVDKKKYGPNFDISLTGTYKYKFDQQQQITADITRSSILATIVLLLYLAFHFRSALAVGLVLVPVFAGLAWTYGITWLVFGKLNIMTGFLGAVLGGLGTEHGIHLLTRYSTLRGQGVSSEDATRQSFEHTGASALISSVVAALTFLAVSFSEFRAFREFGIIASIGMVVVLIAYFLILPGFFGLANRFGWQPSHKASGAMSEVARIIPKHYKGVALVIGLSVVGFMVAMPGIKFNYDFHALEDSSLPSFRRDKDVNRILGYMSEPCVVLTNTPQEERAVVNELKKRKKEHGADSTIDFVAALDDLVPDRQDEKKQVLEQIAETIDKSKSSDPKILQFKTQVHAQPFERNDIPETLRRQFQGVKESAGGFVLVFPNVRLSDGRAVLKFSDEVSDIKLPSGTTLQAAGEAMVLADVLRMVKREAQPILIVAIVLVILAMWITLGSLVEALLCMAPTALSLLALIGLMAITDQPFNYLNIIIIPVLIGTTVDAGVHLISRLRETHDSWSEQFAETGRAIVGGLVTSGVGFAAMLLADHPGLNSLGRLANLGFAMNLVVMILGFPAFLLLLQKKKPETPT